jgi:hypothetical protein
MASAGVGTFCDPEARPARATFGACAPNKAVASHRHRPVARAATSHHFLKNDRLQPAAAFVIL